MEGWWGELKEEDREVKERAAGIHQEESLEGHRATAWRADPCVNGDVLNLC